VLERERVQSSEMREGMGSIDKTLWLAIKECKGLSWDEPAQFHSCPSPDLDGLYGVCFGGTQWRKAIRDLCKRRAFSSLDVFVALVGAAIHSDVFVLDQPWQMRPVVTFGSELQQKAAVRLAGRLGRPFVGYTPSKY
jgi:hypothetical protein